MKNYLLLKIWEKNVQESRFSQEKMSREGILSPNG